ncbi:MAG: right-handed parallel beta-helix repeat-containing protein [Victivallales bacterium]|jgi:parallel beta-helix repeat protein
MVKKMKFSAFAAAIAVFASGIHVSALADSYPGLAAVAEPVKYYVSGTGFDANNGLSPEKAFRNIQRAADVTRPGDTVYVMDGVYKRDEPSCNIVNINRSGKPNAWITYRAFPGHRPELRSRNLNAIMIEGASYIAIDGLSMNGDIDNIKLEYALSQKDNFKNPETSGNGIGIAEKGNQKPHHITISRCKIYNFCGGGIFTRRADYVTIEDNTIRENTFYSPYGSSGISNCQNWNSDGEKSGYKMIIRRNIIHHNLNMIPALAVKNMTGGNGIIIGDLRNPQGNSNQEGYAGRTLIENNVIYCNGGRGVYVFNSDGVDILNNTLYQNSQHPRILDGEICIMSSNDVKVYNNIMCALDDRPANTIKDSNDTVFDFNMVFNGKLSGKAGRNIIGKDPLFLNEKRRGFYLTGKSPAIDAGTNLLKCATDIRGVERPQGRAVDIGAYERD